jgi:hypothetical protein
MLKNIAIGENHMAPIERNRNKTSYGGGRNRQMAVRTIMEAAIKIVKHARASKVVKFNNRGHLRASMADLEISIHALTSLRPDAVSQNKHLTPILSSDPITTPFGLDIWSPNKKVLSAVYYASTRNHS